MSLTSLYAFLLYVKYPVVVREIAGLLSTTLEGLQVSDPPTRLHQAY